MFGIRGMVLSSLAAMVFGPGPLVDVAPRKRAYGGAVYRSAGTRTTHQVQHGQGERSRRLRQIAAGSLRAENGLAVR